MKVFARVAAVAATVAMAFGGLAAPAWADGASDAQAKLNEGVLAYFKDKGATQAVKVLTDGETTKYLSYVHNGDSKDATAIDNVIASLQWVQEGNAIRTKLGLSALPVTDTLMAMAAADADYSTSIHNHAQQFNIGENLAWTTGDPYPLWYDSEKKVWDDAVAKDPSLAQYKDNAYALSQKDPTFYHQVGHYLNIIASDYKVTGYGMNTSSALTTHSQVFDFAQRGVDYGRTMDPASYLADVKEWKANLESQLPQKPSVDRTKLEAVMARGKELKESDWTADSWQGFKSAFDAAKAVEADENASQTDIDQATDRLDTAIKALKRAETTGPTGPTGPTNPSDGVVVYRLYNPNAAGAGSHHYTTNRYEYDALVNRGWRGEGPRFTVASSGVPIYRLYNRHDGSHHYTRDAAERDALAAKGWTYETIAWYVNDNAPDPVYRVYNPYTGEHVYTTMLSESQSLVRHGWTDEGVAFRATAID